MSRVPKYTKAVVRERVTPQLTDLGRIEDAAFESKAISAGLDIATEVGTRIKKANDMSSFNKAFIQKQRDDMQFEADMRKQWSDNPIGFTKEMKKQRKKRDADYTKGLSREAAQMFKERSLTYNLSQSKKDMEWENRTAIEKTVDRAETATEMLATMAYEGKPLDEIANSKSDILNALGDTLTGREKEKFESYMNTTVFAGVVKGMIDSDPYEAKKTLDKGTYNEFFSVDQLRTLNNQTDSAIAKIEKKTLQQSKLNAQSMLVDMTKQGQVILDPYDKNHQNAVEADWQRTLQQNPVQGEELTNLAVDYVGQVGVVPKSMESSINAMMMSGTPEQMSIGSDMLEQMAEIDPSLVNQFNDKTRTLARKVQDNINAGMSRQEAVNSANESIFRSGTPEYQVRVEEYRKESIDFPEGKFTEFFRNDPDLVPAGMKADYNTLLKAYYVDEGLQLDSAQDLAIEKVKNRWSVSTVDGKPRWMKYAPETMYKNGANPEWIQKQLAGDVLALSPLQKDAKKFMESIYIEVAPETVQRPDPSYLVFQKDEQGRIEPLMFESGEQMVFKPDYTKTEEYQNQKSTYKKEVKRSLEAANEKRNAKIKFKELEAELEADLPSELD